MDKFIERRRKMNRMGRAPLAHVSVDLRQEYEPETFSVGHFGQTGWKHVAPHRFGLTVDNDGMWCYVGYHTYWSNGKKYLSGWRVTRTGAWSDISSYEVVNVADAGTANPKAVLRCAEEAVRVWEAGR